MGFRKRQNGYIMPSSPCEKIRDVESITVERDGSLITREVVVSSTPADYLTKHPVVHQEFSLEEQLKAGVSLKDVPCSGMLDSSDNLDYPQNDGAEEKILGILEKENDTNE